jgi:hypothetical protein
MTGEANPVWTPEERAALDRFAAPAPRASFADDIVAAALARPEGAALPPLVPRRRALRGLWKHGRIVLGVAGLSVMSAAAAAAGWFGEAGTRLPVIATIAKVIPEAVKAPAARPKPALAKAEPGPTAPDVASAGDGDVAIDMASVERMARVERFAARAEAELDRRDQRRIAMGLPANSERQRAAIAELRNAKSEEEQRAVIEKLMAARAAHPPHHIRRNRPMTSEEAAEAQRRREAWLALPLCTPEQAVDPRLNRCRPDRRAQIEAFRARCLAAPDGVALPPRCARFRAQDAPMPATPTLPEAGPSADEQPGEPIAQ